MDGDRFDEWAKSLVGGAASRRTALRSVAGAALSALLVPSSIRGQRAACTAGGEPCEFGGLCCSRICALDGTCCHGRSQFGARCRRDGQCCSGRCVRRRCRCRRNQRLCRGVCIGPSQCCGTAECQDGEACDDFAHGCCPSERVATVNARPLGDGRCDCCCTEKGCRCPCGDSCGKTRGECLRGCCCDEDECECPPAGAEFPYTFCCGDGSLGDAGGNPGCCTTPPDTVTCPAINRVR